MNNSREKAIQNKIYTINGQEYFAQKTELGCQGCVSDCENSKPKCTDFPLCSTADLSVIFIKAEK